jgi:hypothetical protein
MPGETEIPRSSIRQFRELLVGRADASGAARAYRELARRPDLAAARLGDRLHWTERERHMTPN